MQLLVAGATGYIGRHLIPRLLAAGHDVRALVRDPAHARARLPAGVEIVAGDVLAPETLAPPLAGVELAYYLVHSMEAGDYSFEERDRAAARNFGQAAKAARVSRIIYLSGLGDSRGHLSAHLRSRQEVGAVLASSGVPVTEFRAGIIIGAGSTSFEMLRELTERLPVMICPRWVTSPIQPIAADDVFTYLVACLQKPETSGRVLEIGGPEVMTYQEMMERFARVRGLRRLIIRVPVLTPRLSSYWVDLVTSVPAEVARPLVEGLRSAVVVRDTSARRVLPFDLTPFDTAVRAALADARPGPKEPPLLWTRRIPLRLAGLAQDRLWPSTLTDQRVQPAAASPAVVYGQLARLGGPNGWYFLDALWRVRGALDAWLGGPGLDRRTPLPDLIEIGARRDFWRVLEAEPGRRLRLQALMRVPGQAELEWMITPRERGKSLLYQTARFRPSGLAGRLYWYGLLPAHLSIFRGLVRAIARQAALPERRDRLSKGGAAASSAIA